MKIYYLEEDDFNILLKINQFDSANIILFL